jgi:hypothetical protein
MIDLASLLRFPCDTSKHPMIAAWQRNAARDDYSDWPLVGVPTGAANGFDVLDIDLEGSSWWDAHRAELPATQIHTTRSGGAHLLFKHAEGLRCSVGRIATGVDVRADGGFVIWWPREGFRVIEAQLNAVAIIGSAITSGYGEGSRLDGPAMPQSGPGLERGIEVSNSYCPARLLEPRNGHVRDVEALGDLGQRLTLCSTT